MVGMFATAVLALTAMCGFLAALLVVADRTVNNYGTCKITINDDKEIETTGGQSLLSALGGEKIFIPSACGGRGSCGLCKLQVHSGAPQILPTEEPHLTDDEIKENVRLSCQLKVREDMEIEIPEELFSIQEFQARVTDIEDLTADIKRLELTLLDPETISFTPGKYIQLQAPAYGKNSDPVYRAYSLASDPRKQDRVEIIVRLVPDGICTTWVFEILEQNDNVIFNGPYGDFQLNYDSDREMIFIAGGSGMAPFCSILDDMKHRQIDRRTNYFFGAKTEGDLFYLDRMKEYEKELANFHFVPALSEPAPEDNWDGETGLITDVVGSHYDDCSDKEAYLCGSPGMIDACIKVLTDRGLQEDRIFYDKFA